jgi:threonine dehydrogenase-like Zn-dependent dehydrogenase
LLGASQVIAIDPVRYRREFAMKMGATSTLDPVAEGAGLVERVREMCKGPDRPALRRWDDMVEGAEHGDGSRRRFRGGSGWRANCAADGRATA